MTIPDTVNTGTAEIHPAGALEPFEGFTSLQTHHCVTGSMRHIYSFNGHDIGEELLLGLGEGVGFMYWHTRGQAPFLGGRAVSKPSMEQLSGQRTGVLIATHTTSSLHRARQTLLESLERHQPVMLQVDKGFLPYFDFGGQEYHFGGHVVVACGYDQCSDQVLIADRDGLHPVPLAALEQARNSTFKPFPPRNGWWTFDFSHSQPPHPQTSGGLSPRRQPVCWRRPSVISEFKGFAWQPNAFRAGLR